VKHSEDWRALKPHVQLALDDQQGALDYNESSCQGFHGGSDYKNLNLFIVTIGVGDVGDNLAKP